MTEIDPNIQAAHGDDYQFQRWIGVEMPPEVKARGLKSAGEWSDPRVIIADPESGFPRTEAWRTCGYCGSMHPEDLLGYIERGETSRVEMADMKYGYPHKVYLDVPNPLVGQLTSRGSSSWRDDQGVYHHEMSAPSPEGPTTPAKFYTRHLLGLDDERFAKIAEWIERATGFHFERREGGMHWQRVSRSAAFRG